jgi:rod shape-determining protein MreC
VHDKQVRRRRAVLGLLVAISLILLTAYFGESPSSPLHSVQRGIVEVLSPVQDGASKVLSPVRDVANWMSDTLRAKTQRDQLQKQVDSYRAELAQDRYKALQYNQLAHELALDQRIGVDSYHPVAASVIERDPTFWYQTIEVDAGSDEGVVKGDPVLADQGLVGDVTTVDASVSIVTLLTDHSYAVPAEVLDGSGANGLLVPSIGNPNQLLLQNLDTHATVQDGDQVVTAGFKSSSNPALQDLYPAGIPIGTVTNFSQNDLLNSAQVQVSPAADMRHFGSVQILTRPHPGSERAQAP